jgi:hypothetical protein
MLSRADISFWLSIYATIQATRTFFLDRARVKISFRSEEEVVEEDGYAFQGQTYTVVTVLNKGRRPVSISNVRARLLNGRSVMMNSKGAMLGEEQHMEGAASDEELDITEVAAFEAHRPLGRPYRKTVAPWFTRMRWHLKSKR